MGETIEVKVIDKKTGEEKILFERPGSECHFMEKFEFERFCIKLRLDWTDQDSVYEEPVLDADIYTKNAKTGENVKYKTGKEKWHHTPITKDSEGNFIYHFVFKEFELVLRRKITVQEGLNFKVKIIRNS